MLGQRFGSPTKAPGGIISRPCPDGKVGSEERMENTLIGSAAADQLAKARFAPNPRDKDVDAA